MANRPQFQWPSQPPPGSNAGDLNPAQSFISAGPSGPRSGQGFPRPIYNGAPYLQPTHPNSSTDYHLVNTRMPGPFVPPGHGAQRCVQPLSGPGYRSSGWSPRPGNFFAMPHRPGYGSPAPPMQVPPQALAQFSGAGPRAMFQMLQQSPPSRQGQGQVQGIPGSMPPASPNQSGASPRTLLSSWLGDPVQERLPLQLQGEIVTVEGKRGSHENQKETDLKVILANIKELVNQAEKAISEILDVVKLQRPTPGSALGVCEVDPRHGVPAAALFRHSLKCPSSASGPLELDSLLQYLQYPQSAPRDPSFRSGLFEDRRSEGHTGTEDIVNLAFKEPFQYSSIEVSSTTPSCPIVKQEMCPLNDSGASKFSAGLTDLVSVRFEGTKSTDAPKASSHTTREFDPSGRLFFYRDAPGVVVTSSFSPIEVPDSFTLSLLPPFLRVEVASESKMPNHYGGRADIRDRANPLTTSVDGNGVKKSDQWGGKGGHYGAAKGTFSKKYGASVSTMAQYRSLSQNIKKESRNIFDAQHLQFLPSMLWLFEREIEAWKDLPTRWPRLVLEAAAGSGRVSTRLVVPWLLVHSPSYGVVLDVAMARHIYSLVKLFLKAVSTEACRFLQEFHTEKHQPFQPVLGITTDALPAEKASNETSFSGRDWRDQVDCMVVAEGGSWLAAKLGQLYEPARSREFVLDLLKFCLKSSGNGVMVSSLDLLEWSKRTNSLKPRCQDWEGNDDAGGSWKGLSTQDRGPVGSARDLSNFEDTGFHLVETENLENVEVRQVEAALDALSERASFGRYINCRIRLHNLTKFQL